MIIISTLIVAFLFSPLVIRYFPEKELPQPPAPSRKEIMKGAEPIKKTGKSAFAFILIHGYNDSPFQLKPLADHLIQKGHSVFVPLLEGHGTKVEDLHNVRYSHWVQTISNAVDEYLKKKKKVFLIGQSMGGTLALHLAGTHPRKNDLQGIVAISAPLFMSGIYNGKIIIHKPFLLYTFYLKLFNKIASFPNTTLDQNICPYVGYGKVYSLSNLHSFVNGLFHTRKCLSEVTVPVQSIMSQNDRTVRIEDQIYIMRKTKSKIKRSDTLFIEENKTTRHLLLTHMETSRRVIHLIDEFISDNK